MTATLTAQLQSFRTRMTARAGYGGCSLPVIPKSRTEKPGAGCRHKGLLRHHVAVLQGEQRPRGCPAVSVCGVLTDDGGGRGGVPSGGTLREIAVCFSTVRRDSKSARRSWLAESWGVPSKGFASRDSGRLLDGSKGTPKRRLRRVGGLHAAPNPRNGRRWSLTGESRNPLEIFGAYLVGRRHHTTAADRRRGGKRRSSDECQEVYKDQGTATRHYQ